jgi:hypothetical protein
MIRYGILGQFEVRDGTGKVPIAQGRQRLLLAVLLVHANQTVSTDRLIDALWGQTAPPTAARSVHNLVSALRKALGDGRLVTDGRGYRLDVADGELDAQRFELVSALGRDALDTEDIEGAARLLREALELWRGPAFGDLAYEHVLQAEAARLDERRLATIEDRVDAELARGRHAEVVAELEVLVAEHRCVSGYAASRSWRCTGPAGRRTRSPRTRTRGGTWSTSSAWSPARSCVTSSAQCSNKIPRSTGPVHRRSLRALRRPAAAYGVHGLSPLGRR